MIKPKYSVDTIVRHVAKNAYGRVKSIWHDGPGYRYEVQHSKWLWSVPEWALAKKKCSPIVPS